MVTVLAGVILTFLGLAVGSFLNVVIYRVPRGESIASPASACPHCRHAVRWKDNIPVISWLLLRGRCRDCQWPIPRRYVLVEVANAAVWWLPVAAQEQISEKRPDAVPALLLLRLLSQFQRRSSCCGCLSVASAYAATAHRAKLCAVPVQIGAARAGHFTR